MEYLLFAGYLIFFAWLVTKISFFKTSGLSKPQLIIIFLLKVITGIFYGWMGIVYGGFARIKDTWSFHHNGVIEYQLLGNNPKEYFTNLFHNPYQNGLGSFFGSIGSYWNDLKGNVFIKILSIFDVFSFGHYYINVIFYSFITLFGPMAFYKVMKDVFPGRKTAVLLSAFFIPSFFYWTGGIGKEGLIFVGIGLIIYHMYRGNKEKKFGLKRIAGILLGMLILLLLRNFLLIIVIPPIIAWLLAYRFSRYSLACFVSVYVFFGILFFTLRYFDPRLDFPQAVVDKQQAFIQIVGNSSIPIKQLKPNAISFLINIPQAITLSILRPYPGDIKHLLSLGAAIEIDLLLFLFILLLIKRKKDVIIQYKSTIYFCLFFSFSVLLAIGFSVNNLGAIVRYRSTILPLLIVIPAALINWKGLSINSIKK